jgi:hypothetical protein
MAPTSGFVLKTATIQVSDALLPYGFVKPVT